MFWCSDWHKIVLCFAPLHENLEFWLQRRSLLQAAAEAAAAAAAKDASRAAVHVESSDVMRSRKAQCQAPPDNPETGDTYHSREKSCAGGKIEHQNVYRGIATVQVRMYVYKRGRLLQTRDLWRKRANME